MLYIRMDFFFIYLGLNLLGVQNMKIDILYKCCITLIHHLFLYVFTPSLYSLFMEF